MAGIKHQTVCLTDQLNDDQILGILSNFSDSLDSLENDLDRATKAQDSSTLTSEEHIKLDTYLAYANSTLFWMYLKLQGTDMSNHHILHDLARAKEMLAREKEINDAKSAPHLDIAASKRFIAAGMHTRFVEMNGVMVTEAQYKRSLSEAGSNKP